MRLHPMACVLPVLLWLMMLSAATTGAQEVGSSGPDIETFMQITAPAAPFLAPDGTLYASLVADGVWQLFRRLPGAPVDGPMEQLTRFEDGVSQIRISPDGRVVLAGTSTGGSGQHDIYRVDPETATVTPLLCNPEVRYTVHRWLRDSSGFLYVANEESPADFYIHLYDLRSGEKETILRQPGYWSAVDITADKRHVLAFLYQSSSCGHTYELDRETGELTSHDLSGGDHVNTPIGYLPGDRQILMISDYLTGDRRVFRRHLDTGHTTHVLEHLDPYQIEEGIPSDNREYVAIAYGDAGYSSMELVHFPECEPVPLPEIPKGLVECEGIHEDLLVFTVNNTRSPGIAYTWHIGSSDPPAPLTEADDQGIDLSRFALPAIVGIRSFDGLEFPAFLYTPPGYVRGERIPFIVHFHGGPASQARPKFYPKIQYFLSRGFGVLCPNVRGSRGYGREFLRLDDYQLRWDSVRDGVAAAECLVEHGYAEGGRIATYGGSYGGFMSVAVALEGGDLFGAAVDLAGIVNFETYLQNTKPYRRALREAEYGPMSDPEFLRSISPIHRATEIHAPMLIAHGLNDPRVPVSEAMQLAVTLQKAGRDPELLFFPDEGHRISKSGNEFLLYRRVARFLERHLGEQSGEASTFLQKAD